MGYDLHITRRKHWSDKGDEIAADEWLTYVRGEPELCLLPENGAYFAEWSSPSELEGQWLDWHDGQIYTKNPQPALIEKMVAIARRFGATVQGDDGETYQGSSEAPRHRAPALGERVAGWFEHFRSRRPLRIEHEPIPFGVGDKVRDAWGNEHTVIEIDPTAQHGMGVIRTRRDDGTELGYALIAHGLTPVKKTDEP